jgi:hypothetical protein
MNNLLEIINNKLSILIILRVFNRSNCSNEGAETRRDIPSTNARHLLMLNNKYICLKQSIIVTLVWLIIEKRW